MDPETCPIVDLPWEEYRALWQPWRRALILKVLGRNLSFKLVEQRVRRLWQLDLGCELIDMAKGFIIARFYSQQDYLKVLEGGPWMVLGSYLTISKWRSNFTPNDHIGSSTLVWIRIPNIPIEMFKEHILMRMGNKLGRAVRVDTTSVDVIRGNYARICVEVGLQKPLKPTVMILGRIIPVEYEGLSRICFKCGYFGHRAGECSSNTSTTATASPPPPGSAPHQHPVEPTYTPTTPFGPWMLPAYVRKKQQIAQKRMQYKAAISDANRRLNHQVAQTHSEDRDPSPGTTAWRPVGKPPSAGSQNRGRTVPPARQVAPSSKPLDVTRPGATSRFSVLENCSEEEDILNSLEALKRKIQNLPGPSHLAGLAHDKRIQKNVNWTGGPRMDSLYPGPSTKAHPARFPAKSTAPSQPSFPPLWALQL